jgi:FkbM family methyltransferase
MVVQTEALLSQFNEIDRAEIEKMNYLFLKNDVWGSLYEEVTFALYAAVLRPGDAAVDCGANMGEHTAAMSRYCGEAGRVFAFEAAPEMMQKARERNESNKNIAFFEQALWHKAGEVLSFHYFPNEHGLSGLVDRNDVTAAYHFDVRTTTLDEAVDRPVQLMKLDIEGAEYHALSAAERIMTHDKPIIIFENGRESSAKQYGYSSDDFFALFASRGYSVFSIAGMPLTPELWDSWMPFQFMALNAASPRAARALHCVHSYVLELSAKGA